MSFPLIPQAIFFSSTCTNEMCTFAGLRSLFPIACLFNLKVVFVLLVPSPSLLQSSEVASSTSPGVTHGPVSPHFDPPAVLLTCGYV